MLWLPTMKILLFISILVITSYKPQEEHKWEDGPFWITHFEGDPSGFSYDSPVLVKVQHCSMCGMIRIPKYAKK